MRVLREMAQTQEGKISISKEGDKKMKEDKYSVFVDNDKIAEHMPLEVAGILIQALCEKWEDVTAIIIAIEPVRVEEEDD